MFEKGLRLAPVRGLRSRVWIYISGKASRELEVVENHPVPLMVGEIFAGSWFSISMYISRQQGMTGSVPKPRPWVRDPEIWFNMQGAVIEMLGLRVREEG